MNYTTNYHLPQWVESDRIMMEDFNETMVNIDSGLEGVKNTAHAESAAAQSAAAAAQATADAAYSPSNKPYVIGSYRGTGNTQTITLGFRPSLLIIAGDKSSSTPSGHYALLGSHFGVVTADHGYDSITLTDTGFTVTDNSTMTCPALNDGGPTFAYIAFR